MEAIKSRITGYWTKRTENFSRLRLKELRADKRRLWLAEFEKLLPEGRALDILDAGTGTGFFAFLLAPLGHRVTGIDLTESMVAQARADARSLGIAADFLVMDAEEPVFPARSFDAVVTRNLTWTLPHLERAYRAWFRLLKPGGVLINFDADYCRERPAPDLPPRHAHCGLGAPLMKEYESLKDELRPAQRPRPLWDGELLRAAGFSRVEADFGAWKRLYAERDEFYNPAPVFRIRAVKAPREEGAAAL